MTAYKILDDKVVFTLGTPSGWTAATLQQGIDAARSNGLTLFIRPGTYDTGDLHIDSSGGTNPIVMEAIPGSVTIRYTGGTDFFSITGVSDCVLRGIVVDRNNISQSGWAAAILVRNASRTLIENCRILNSPQRGLYLVNCGTRQTVGSSGTNEILASAGRIVGCEISNCDVAIFSFANVALHVESNTIHNCSNNGILIWQDSPLLDGSSVVDNSITYIRADAGGTGQNGNAINVYNANGCNVINNRIRFCKFTAVRANASSNTVIANNNIYAMAETAIWAEETGIGDGQTNVGTVISGNVINICRDGISATNFSSGGRLATITGNVVRNATAGSGIFVEGDSIINANLVECMHQFGVVLGTNSYTRNLIASDNVLRNCAAGVAISSSSGAGYVLVTDNMIETPSGISTEYGIVTYTFTGTSRVVDDTMSGITPSSYPRIKLGMNVVHDLQTPDPIPTSCVTQMPSF